MHGVEIALMREDIAAATHWEAQLKDQTSGDTFEWRYLLARCLVAQLRSSMRIPIGARRSD